MHSLIFNLLPFKIDQPDLGLSQVFLLKGLENPVVAAYHKFQVDMAVLYGADRKQAEEQMREAFNFETALANVKLLSCFFRNL
jgi:neprilysin